MGLLSGLFHSGCQTKLAYVFLSYACCMPPPAHLPNLLDVITSQEQWMNCEDDRKLGEHNALKWSGRDLVKKEGKASANPFPHP
jgi:hypothetical protein